MRRRRRRGQPLSPRATMIMGAIGVVVVVGGFFYLVSVADNAAPEQSERRIELPDAFKS